MHYNIIHSNLSTKLNIYYINNNKSHNYKSKTSKYYNYNKASLYKSELTPASDKSSHISVKHFFSITVSLNNLKLKGDNFNSKL